MIKKAITISFLGIFILMFSGCANGSELLLDSSDQKNSSKQSESTDSFSKAPLVFSTETSLEIPLLTKNFSGINGIIYQLKVPVNWIEETDPQSQNDDFEFMISDLKESEFVGCIAENKEDFVDIEAYTDLATEHIEGFTGKTVRFENKNVNGKQINAAELDAVIEGMKISYIYHIVETKTSYVQLYAWTVTRLFDGSHDRLETILNSFEEK